MDPSTQPTALHDRLRARAFAMLQSPIRFLHGRCRLLALPVEIRLRIYEYALTPDKSGNPVGLLRVCKQIHSECYAVALPYLRLRFRRVDEFLSFWMDLREGLKKKVKQVKIRASTADDIYKIPAILERMCEGLKLDDLTLVFEEEVSRVVWYRVEGWSGIAEMKKTLESVSSIDVVHIINMHEANAKHLNFIFEMLQLASVASLRSDRHITMAFVCGFVEEKRARVVNPGYRIVRKAVLASVLGKPGLVNGELREVFWTESERAQGKYPACRGA